MRGLCVNVNIEIVGEPRADWKDPTEWPRLVLPLFKILFVVSLKFCGWGHHCVCLEIVSGFLGVCNKFGIILIPLMPQDFKWMSGGGDQVLGSLLQAALLLIGWTCVSSLMVWNLLEKVCGRLGSSSAMPSTQGAFGEPAALCHRHVAVRVLSLPAQLGSKHFCDGYCRSWLWLPLSVSPAGNRAGGWVTSAATGCLGSAFFVFGAHTGLCCYPRRAVWLAVFVLRAFQEMKVS